jgi:hypothetical protein
MTIEGMARAFARFTASYPNAKKPDEATVRFWASECHFSDELIEASASAWVRKERNYPTLPAFLELVRANAPHKAIDSHRCGVCVDGWEWLEEDGKTLRRCRNGCLPPPMSSITTEWTERPTMDGTNWIEHLRGAREYQSRRRREIGDAAYLEERGYDPEHYRIDAGMIIAGKTRPKMKLVK